MKKIRKDDYFELAVFLMDYHTGQWSRGYRLLSRLGVRNISPSICKEARKTEIYGYLVDNYKGKV